MYKLFLTIRYLRKRRIAYFAIAAVTLCVAMVLIVMSVMGGFLDSIKQRARGLLGEVIVDNRAFGGFPLYEEFMADVSVWPEIEAITPVLYTWGLVRFPDTEQTGTVRVVGIRLDEYCTVNAFRDSLYYEQHYPGTTHLGEQRQPRLGLDWELIKGGTMARPIVSLPEPYASALTESQAAGVIDEDAPPPGESDPNIFDPPGWFLQERVPPPMSLPADYVGEPWPGVILGRDIVAERRPDGRYIRHYMAGDMAHLTLLQVTPGGQVDTPIRQPFRYADDSRTGIYEIDSKHVYCDFDLLQKLLRMDAAERPGGGTAPARCSQLQIKIAAGVDAYALCERLEDHYHSFLEPDRFDLSASERRLVERIDALTWEESQEHIIAPVEKERALVTILFGIISMVAAVLVLCILYMIVLQKTRDIGVVKALGGSSAGVALIFVGYGAAVGLVGGTVGTIAGYYFVTYINEIQDALIALNPRWQVWDRSVYSFDEIPHTVRSADMLTVFISAIVASTLGSVLAAWRAGAMHPLEALRYE